VPLTVHSLYCRACGRRGSTEHPTVWMSILWGGGITCVLERLCLDCWKRYGPETLEARLAQARMERRLRSS
jgi:uncharacterized Zn-finger protein